MTSARKVCLFSAKRSLENRSFSNQLYIPCSLPHFVRREQVEQLAVMKSIREQEGESFRLAWERNGSIVLEGAFFIRWMQCKLPEHPVASKKKKTEESHRCNERKTVARTRSHYCSVILIVYKSPEGEYTLIQMRMGIFSNTIVEIYDSRFSPRTISKTLSNLFRYFCSIKYRLNICFFHCKLLKVLSIQVGIYISLVWSWETSSDF